MGKRTSGTTNLIKGTRGNDVLEVTRDTNSAWTIDAGAGNDMLTGGDGGDTLLGSAGNDIVFGMPNDVRLDGGMGYDTLDVSAAADSIRYIAGFGGQLTYWPDETPSTYAVASGFERVIGGAGADYLMGGGAAETLVGGGGGDSIDGGTGNDILVGDYLSLATYNPLERSALPTDGGDDYFEFTHSGGGADQILDFDFGDDHLFFYGVPQPDQSQIYVSGSDLVVPWANGTVTLTGLGGLDPASYGQLFTLTNGDISVA